MSVNGVRVHQSILPNHPHDSRGALSYLREARGAYGYLAHATIEGVLLKSVLDKATAGRITLRCEVPRHILPAGGLTIYGGDCGRYPLPPTLIIE
jgi:hypothetical protein